MPDVSTRALDHLCWFFFFLFFLLEAPDAPFFEQARFGEGGFAFLIRFLSGLAFS